MNDFVSLAQTFGLPLAMTITAILVLGRVIVLITREKDRINDSRYDDLKKQFEARLIEQKAQYDSRLAEVVADRDFIRDRLYQALGVTDGSTAALEELARRLKPISPPDRR